MALADIFACAVVEIDHPWSVNITDYDLRSVVAIQIGGDHGIGQRRGRLELNTAAKVALAVIEVHKTAQFLVARGNAQVAIPIEVGDCHGAGG
jgi:hypothetical protein